MTDAILYRDTANLTSLQMRKQIVTAVHEETGIEISQNALRALDEAWRTPADGLDDESALPTLTGAQSFVTDTLVMALRYRSQIVYATSMGEVFGGEAAALRFDTSSAPDKPTTLSISALQGFKSGNSELDPQQLFADLLGLFRDHLDWPEPYYPTLLAVWVMATYMYRVFTYFPYIVFSSLTKRSGKSLAEEVISETAFNATPVLVNPTPAYCFPGRSPQRVHDDPRRSGESQKWRYR